MNRTLNMRGNGRLVSPNSGGTAAAVVERFLCWSSSLPSAECHGGLIMNLEVIGVI